MPRFTPRVRKQKALKRLGDGSKADQDEEPDPNAAAILPEEQRLRRARFQALQAELKAGQPKFSAKKQKRLDKYIENKLKKDENLDLLKKLSAAKTDTSQLRSSRTLGGGRKRHEPQQASDTEASEWGGFASSSEDSSSADEIELKPEGLPPPHVELNSPVQGTRLPKLKAVRDPVAPANGGSKDLGSGLKRPLDTDSSGQPVIKKRQRINTRVAEHRLREMLTNAAFEDAGSTTGSDFDASASEEESNDDSDDSEAMSDSDSEGHEIPASLFGMLKPDANTQRRGDGVREILEGWSKAASGFEDHPSHIEQLALLPQTLKAHAMRGTDRATETEPLAAEVQMSDAVSARSAYAVHVKRSAVIEEARLKLPVVVEEQKIMEAIHNNPAVVVCGATGSGKTTQVPQFLFEAGYGAPGGATPGMIGVTQPRRVAAVSMAKRVAEEMGEQSDKVSYQIRFDSTVKQHSSIKFMTDGILLREISEDFLLKKYSAIVIDEAHERSVNTDILIGMLSRVSQLRLEMFKEGEGVTPLKLVIMSATLVAGDFVTNDRLFPKQRPPLVDVEGRQFDVIQHFARRTKHDYLEQAFQKVARGHRQLPPGSMLVFLTGQSEIAALSKRLKRALGAETTSDGPAVRLSGKDVPLEADDLELGEDRVEDYGDDEEDPNGEADDEGFNIDDGEPGQTLRAKILPLYSQLPTREQLRVFEAAPDDTRVIILATNVAETSITIPNVRYVFDCGRSKAKKYDPRTGVQSFQIGWISKASAAQRLGRAGRTGPGHCYRLYSSAIYEAQFEEFTLPEIASAPIESVVLLLKSMQIPGDVTSFPFPTPPDAGAIVRAESLLASLSAIDTNGRITETGKALSLYPISPRFARMLVLGQSNGLGRLAAALVAAVATPEMFVPESQLGLGADSDDSASDGGVLDQSARLAEDARSQRRKTYRSMHGLLARFAAGSDALKLLRAFGTYLAAAHAHEAALSAPSARANLTNTPSPETECARLFMRPKACTEARSLYQQLLRLLAQHHPAAGLDPSGAPPPPPTAAQDGALRQIVAAGFVDQVAMRWDLLDEGERARLAALQPPGSRIASGRPPRTAAEVPYVPLFGGDVLAFVHVSSVLSTRSKTDIPGFLTYERLQEGQTRTALHPMTPVSTDALRNLAAGTPLLEWGKPVGKVESLPFEGGRARRRVWVVASLVNAGERGARRRRWPLLPAVQVVQVRDRKGEWREEKAV